MKFLNHVLFWIARDLARKLADFQAYYNVGRVHASLEGDTPTGFAGHNMRERAELDDFCWTSHCRGLFQLPAAA